MPVQTKRTRRPKLLPIVQGSFSPLCKQPAHTPSQVSPPAASRLVHHPPSSSTLTLIYISLSYITHQCHHSCTVWSPLPLSKLHTLTCLALLSSSSTSQPRTFNNIPQYEPFLRFHQTICPLFTILSQFHVTTASSVRACTKAVKNPLFMHLFLAEKAGGPLGYFVIWQLCAGPICGFARSITIMGATCI